MRITLKRLFLSGFLFLLFILETQASSQQDNEEKKVVCIHLNSNKHEIISKKEKINGHEDYDISKNESTLIIQDLKSEIPIQFIFEHTKIKYQEAVIPFKDSSLFLNKINSLRVDEQDNKYNHLCLTLFAIYKEGDDVNLVESPLYVKWKDILILTENGYLEKTANARAKFYIKIDNADNDKLAYFMSGHPEYHKKALINSGIFPIQSTSCYDKDYTPICQRFYKAENEDNTKPDCKKSLCRHTEPNALFHILKHKNELFQPFIDKARSINEIQSVGIRFFSHYESCRHCLSFLNENKDISLSIAR